VNELALQSWMEVFLMVRRRRSTMFLVAREGDTVAEVRRMVAGLCGQQAASVRLFLQENPEKELEVAATLASLGLTAAACRASSPGTLVAAWGDEAPEVTPYSSAPELPDVMKPQEVQEQQVATA